VTGSCLRFHLEQAGQIGDPPPPTRPLSNAPCYPTETNMLRPNSEHIGMFVEMVAKTHITITLRSRSNHRWPSMLVGPSQPPISCSLHERHAGVWPLNYTSSSAQRHPPRHPSPSMAGPSAHIASGHLALDRWTGFDPPGIDKTNGNQPCSSHLSQMVVLALVCG
jgi:hypothetical protein